MHKVLLPKVEAVITEQKFNSKQSILITQKHWRKVNEDTLCTRPEHSFPPSPSKKTRSGVSDRPRLLSSAVFSCFLTWGLIGSLTVAANSVCRC